ncbi:MAG: UDP-N-acetylglucosamine 2-epimerase (non-hydrolyzing) [Flavobacteriaceae bacterium]|nr:UDP-N-acetylglucosamine 2-epimerase (non-hydrolyzing) [Flavobacteriaceae bacterium]
MDITIVAGARPNFMKIAPIIDAIKESKKKGKDINYRLVHTGQHYDKYLSDTFFNELGIPTPDINLAVKSGTQAEQTAAIMVGFEKYLKQNHADLVMVVGDVNSTMACSIVAKKEQVDLAHVEAGIRSGDMAMPEEINRIVTDSLSDYFFTTSTIANANLKALGVDENRIFYVGNVMIDTLRKNEDRFRPPQIWNKLNLSASKYFVMTLHRPSNVDERKELVSLISAIAEFSKGLPIIFPIHPRTLKMLGKNKAFPSNLHFVDPLGYLEFNYLVKHSFAVITDSGGITEETTVLNIPCMTLRENTERPETCSLGTNVLIGKDLPKLKASFDRLFKGKWKQGQIPELWDGKAAVRIVETMEKLYGL